MKKPSRKSLVEKLDKIFSIYIRRKDAVDDIAVAQYRNMLFLSVDGKVAEPVSLL